MTGERFRQLRKELGLSQIDLSDKLGVNPSDGKRTYSSIPGYNDAFIKELRDQFALVDHGTRRYV